MHKNVQFLSYVDERHQEAVEMRQYGAFAAQECDDLCQIGTELA